MKNVVKYGVYMEVFGVEDYVTSDMPLFVGSREECVKWVEENQYSEFGERVYDRLTINVVWDE